MGNDIREENFMKIAYIAQARMTSNRLPGKVAIDIFGESSLKRVIERMRLSRHDLDIIVATTTNSQDDIVEIIAKECGAKVFRGSENNVLSRYYYAAKENRVDVIIRITCDDLLLDPRWLLDDLLDEFLSNGSYDFYCNMEFLEDENRWIDLEPCAGCKVEIFKFSSLEKCFNEAKDPYCLEHVTPYFYMNPHIFKVGGRSSRYYGSNILPDKFGTDLDTEEDLILLRKIYEELYPLNNRFSTKDIIDLMIKKPDLQGIVKDIKRTPVTYHGEGTNKIIWDNGINPNI